MEISQLSRLVTLDLSVYSGELEITDLGKLVRNFIKIKQLYLDGVSISADGQEWQATLLQIPTLQELSMVGCNLSGPIHSSLTRLENLTYIYLEWNNLSSAVPEAFANFRNLRTLSLAGCGLIGMFPQKILQMPTLSFIDISFNSNLHGFFPEFPLNGSLQTLSVDSTNFLGQLPNSIGNLKKLSTLDLDSSQFNGALPNSLSNLTQLVYLDLRSNNFTGSIPSLGMCKNLQNILLSDNLFTGAISSADFENLINLVEIDVYNNFFTGMIPTSIFMLPSLRSVTLSKNKFYGQLNDFINASSSIQWLDLSENHLEGPIPISLFQLTSLTDLTLSSNKFSGTIELNMLSKLENLINLDISHNNITISDASTSLPNLKSISLASCKFTTFPQVLKNHSRLRHIDLSNNHFAGTIPQWIWNNNFLSYLNLSHNYFTDWEEPMLYNISDFSVLDFHSNLLQGPLPTLPRLISYLDFSNNNLSSVIPESICNATGLEVLDLSNNSLTGRIPKCLIPMNGTLKILDLGGNKLNGSIHPSLGLCSLRSLHLNGNSLRGKLPKYLANCELLEILDIGDNQIHDLFPCWLMEMYTLQVLVLRSNKLHGSLKCSGTEIASPPLQIFDLASNNFGGRIPMSFFETWKLTMVHQNDGSDFLSFPLEFPTQIHDDPWNRYGEGQVVDYQARVMVTSKGQQMKLVKILSIFTAIDLSCNNFKGMIPQEFGLLNALYILNLSHNAFSGPIPSSLGNMTELESLDLSHNCLSGIIPTQMTKLSFLSVLNLSFNHLVGRIPTGTQIQSFPADSFIGNDGLCGLPLSHNCSGDQVQGRMPPPSISNLDTENSVDWNFISVELGFCFGIGILALSLVFYKSGRKRYWKCVDDILYLTIPHLDFVYERRGQQSYRTLLWKPHRR